MENQPSATAFDRIFHFNINCTSLERTLPFYQMLGFKVVLDFGDGMESREMAEAFGLERARVKGVHLRMGDDRQRPPHRPARVPGTAAGGHALSAI